MKIGTLQVGQGRVDVEGKVTDKSEIRQFDKFGKSGKVCTATVKDDSGEIKLTLWNEQTDTVLIGSSIRITNGYVSEFRGEKQLSTGKFGTLEVLEGQTQDHGEHILTQDEKEEADALNEDLPLPDAEDEITEDEKEEAELLGDGSIDIDEEKVD